MINHKYDYLYFTSQNYVVEGNVYSVITNIPNNIFSFPSINDYYNF